MLENTGKSSIEVKKYKISSDSVNTAVLKKFIEEDQFPGKIIGISFLINKI